MGRLNLYKMLLMNLERQLLLLRVMQIYLTDRERMTRRPWKNQFSQLSLKLPIWQIWLNNYFFFFCRSRGFICIFYKIQIDFYRYSIHDSFIKSILICSLSHRYYNRNYTWAIMFKIHFYHFTKRIFL